MHKGRSSFIGSLLIVLSCAPVPKSVETNPAVKAERGTGDSWSDQTDDYADAMKKQGREVFRYDTFGSEAFWGDQLHLHQAVAGQKNGGVGAGLPAKSALELGLKVDIGKLPSILVEAIRGGHVDLDKPDTTVELLRADAVIGVKAFFDGKTMRSIGITCALCHSTVNDSLAKGIGSRLDGWPNRDLDVGKIASLAPNLKPFSDILGVDEATVKKVLLSWGPGKYDAELNLDGKAFRPDGKSAATVLPAAFGLLGVNLHTYTGWGSVTYWNAYVANTQMYGQGTFFDPRLARHEQFPLTKKTGFDDKRPRGAEDKVTAKLGALHYYQLSLPPPKPPKGSYDPERARRGEALFASKARCSTCHVPPLFTEPGWSMHAPEEIGIDAFQANRSPERSYRTTPLRGLFVRMKGGFYHDGRFPTLDAVVDHYDAHLKLGLASTEKADLVEYLKSL
jgi:hypothetical protein